MKFLGVRISLFAAALGAAACSDQSGLKPDPFADAGPPPGSDGPLDPKLCGRGQNVPGATPPDGFCLKHYAQVGEARSLAFAPNGDLFVGAPGQTTSGGASGGPGAVILLTDDNHDGIAEQHTFVDKVVDVHAVAVGDGFLYFTTQNTVWRTPYEPGMVAENRAAREDLGLPASFGMGGRWTHGLARSASGTLVTSRGEYGQCSATALGGEISTIGEGGALTSVARGFRNPMYLRCHPHDEVCAAMELGEDTRPGAREKMLMLKPGTNYGFPCCFTAGKPASSTSGIMCTDITPEDAQFVLSETPFGFDWSPSAWPAPYADAVFVALHGSAYSPTPWEGARIVYAATDPTTHAPVQDWQDFQKGFGPDGLVLERPSDIAFSPDGRMFFADDQGGRVYWMAPTDLDAPN